MSSIIYGACALVAFLCASLLLVAYRRKHYRLLLWTGLCFVGFTLNNALLVVDKVVYSDVDLTIYRSSIALLSVMVLVYGLVWDSQ
jgi:cytochrome bd-type quinol oxidase subunit 2